jgi:hypothetical protein
LVGGLLLFAICSCSAPTVELNGEVDLTGAPPDAPRFRSALWDQVPTSTGALIMGLHLNTNPEACTHYTANEIVAGDQELVVAAPAPFQLGSHLEQHGRWPWGAVLFNVDCQKISTVVSDTGTLAVSSTDLGRLVGQLDYHLVNGTRIVASFEAVHCNADLPHPDCVP